MKTSCFLPVALTILAAAIPVDPDCPRIECYTPVNDCGVIYGGCWNDCDPRPTFEAPLCIATTTANSTITPTAIPNLTIAVTATSNATITGPIIRLIPTPTETGKYCPDICVDWVFCGNQQHHECYNDCDGIKPTFTPPPCTMVTSTRTTSSKAPKKTKPCTAVAGKSWMCPPPTWQ